MQVPKDALSLESLRPYVERVFHIAAPKVHRVLKKWMHRDGAPVFTRRGVYVSRAWTEWTQGFLFGNALWVSDVTQDRPLFTMTRRGILTRMPSYLTHIGVHDHGFNTLSAWGNLADLRLRAGGTEEDAALCRQAIRVSGAVQAARWTALRPTGGYIYSFHGPHSLFCDSIRSARVMTLAALLGQELRTEGDVRISLFARVVEHLRSVLTYNVYYGDGRDMYDVPGRVAHEAQFNIIQGSFVGPGSHQGFSPYTTWMRGLAWVMLGCAEQLECLECVPRYKEWVNRHDPTLLPLLRKAAQVTADFYLQHTPTDGIPYWDTGAPGLVHLPPYTEAPADPNNRYEPVDSSAAAIAAQAFLRLGRWMKHRRSMYWNAGLSLAKTLFEPPYLEGNPRHEGLLVHVVYHRPRGWDHAPDPVTRVPRGESGLWGDYHLLELAVYLWRLLQNEPPHTFFTPADVA
jgi:hypothetical protein